MLSGWASVTSVLKARNLASFRKCLFLAPNLKLNHYTKVPSYPNNVKLCTKYLSIRESWHTLRPLKTGFVLCCQWVMAVVFMNGRDSGWAQASFFNRAMCGQEGVRSLKQRWQAFRPDFASNGEWLGLWEIVPARISINNSSDVLSKKAPYEQPDGVTARSFYRLMCALTVPLYPQYSLPSLNPTTRAPKEPLLTCACLSCFVLINIIFSIVE